jgi:F0F1-type ATP synthase assembly protein I
MAFQFLGAIIIGVLIGKWLDRKFETSSPVFTALVSLFFVVASLFLVIRDVMKRK